MEIRGNDLVASTSFYEVDELTNAGMF